MKCNCDRTWIDDFFNRETLQESFELTVQLENCEVCRQYFDEKAATPEQWLEAERLLQSTEFDVAGTTWCSAGGIDEWDGFAHDSIHAVIDSLAPTDDPNGLGRLGTYEVKGVVGAGGMGVVLKAVDPSLDRVVAIKVLASHLSHRVSARLRFAREAKAAAAVIHPNVIPIHSVATDGPIPYLVMSYIRGDSLQRRLEKEGKLQPLEILRIGAQVAGGLAAAHDQGLVHRDIKPANILLEQGVERVALTDFGLARAVDDASLTREGSIAGTPQYMSPEQARAEPVDHQSDLFSLGSVLYALACGHPPFEADTSLGVMRQISDGNPRPIKDINREFPEWFCWIIEKLMARDKTARFESASEVSALLESCLNHSQQRATMDVPEDLFSWHREEPNLRVPITWKHVLGGLSTMSLAIIVVVGMLIWSPGEAPPDDPANESDDSPLTFSSGALQDAFRMLSEDTEYAPGYTEQAFNSLKIGQTVEDVESKLGKPLRSKTNVPLSRWLYAPEVPKDFESNGHYPSMEKECNVITFDKDGVFLESHGQSAGTIDRPDRDGNVMIISGLMSPDGVTPGPLGITRQVRDELKNTKISSTAFLERFGPPQAKYITRAVKWMVYSHSPSGGDYRQRMVGIDEDGRVCEKWSQFYWD